MNNITRRFASSGNLFTKRIQSFAGAGSASGVVVGLPSFEQHYCQYRRFGSIISRGHDHSACTGKGVDVSVLSSLSSLSIGRGFSSNATATSAAENNDDNDEQQQQQVLSPTSPTMFTDSESGEKYGVVLDTRKLPKLKPSVVRRRLDKCRTYIGREKSIRQSPWKLNRICQLAAGLTLEEALTQLKFCDLKNADLVAKVLKRTSNLSDIRDGLQISQLEVKECFATKSLMLRRIKTMGRGRWVALFLFSFHPFPFQIILSKKVIKLLKCCVLLGWHLQHVDINVYPLHFFWGKSHFISMYLTLRIYLPLVTLCNFDDARHS